MGPDLAIQGRVQYLFLCINASLATNSKIDHLSLTLVNVEWESPFFTF